MAVTTVVLMRADGDDSAIFSLGSKLTEWSWTGLATSFFYAGRVVMGGI